MNGDRRDTGSSSEESVSDRSTPKNRRSRTRTYDESDSYSTDYSDDFESDNRTRSITPPHRKKPLGKRSTGKPYASDQLSVGTLRSSGTTKKSSLQAARRGTYQINQKSYAVKQPRRSNTTGSKRSPRRPLQDAVTRHMIAAKQSEINEIQNRLHDAKQKLELAENENKVLKVLQHRQDKAISRYESAENDLPRLISRNFEDRRVLKSRLRQTQEAEKVLESRLRANNDEMQRMENTLRKLKKMVYDKSLGEKSELATQLTDAENSLHLATRKITNLDRKLDLSVNSFTRQLNSERLKHKETRDKMEKLHDEYKVMDAKLKEKERALDVSNIYSLRKSPGKALLSIEAPKSPPTRALLMTSETQTDLKLADQCNAPEHALPNGYHDPASQHDLSNGFGSTPHSQMTGSPKRDVRKRSKGGQSVFLTTTFDSPLSSPNNSFITDSSGFAELQNNAASPQVNTRHASSSNKVTQPYEDQHTPRTNYEEQMKKNEREKLQVQKHKEKLLSRMREIEAESNQPQLVTTPTEVRPRPPSASKRKPEYVRSLLRNAVVDDEDEMHGTPFGKPVTPKREEIKPQREISFGGYAPTVGGVPSRRKEKARQVSPKRSSPESGSDDVPLFDLNSGKENKKSDLLTQLFGHQDKPNPVLASGSSSTE